MDRLFLPRRNRLSVRSSGSPNERFGITEVESSFQSNCLRLRSNCPLSLVTYINSRGNFRRTICVVLHSVSSGCFCCFYWWSKFSSSVLYTNYDVFQQMKNQKLSHCNLPHWNRQLSLTTLYCCFSTNRYFQCLHFEQARSWYFVQMTS